MNIRIGPYPFNNDCALACTIDDLHPESSAEEENLDFGYSTQSIFWQRISQARKLIPNLKYTIFSVPDWRDKEDFPTGIFFPLRIFWRKRRSYPVNKFLISKPDFKEWVAMVNSFIHSGSVEIGYHGLYHHQFKEKFYPSQELYGKNADELNELFASMEAIFLKSGIKVKSGFRSPGWAINDTIIHALRNRKYQYSANSSDFCSSVSKNHAQGAGLKGMKLHSVTYLTGKLININANCYPHQTDRAVEIAKEKGIIVIHCHIAPTVWGLRYVDVNFVKNLTNIVNEIRNQTMSHVWFATLSEIVEYEYARKTLVYKLNGRKNEIVFNNPSEYELKGLTVHVNNQPYIIHSISACGSYTLHLDNLSQKSKKVSIVLTVYNGEKNILTSLQSLASQTYKNIEIIVVNDGSTDDTAHLVQQYIKTSEDSRIKIINQRIS